MFYFVLAALRRSKKRVRAVISTELPFLISKEFSSGQENDPSVVNNCVAAAHMHRERWNTLFNQMDKALTEEEKQLVSILEVFATYLSFKKWHSCCFFYDMTFGLHI